MIELALALVLAAAPQARMDQVPPECVEATFAGWEACAAAAGEGTASYALAMINLGSRAYIDGDYAAALSFYDRAEIPGRTISSDVLLHAFRGDAAYRAGRIEPARRDARFAWGFLTGRPPVETPPAELRPINDEIRFAVLTSILPILKDDDRTTFEEARAMFMGLAAPDGFTLSNRATVLVDLGEFDAAVADGDRAASLQPDHPGVLNNRCYVLTRAGRPEQGLSSCERAISLLPGTAALHHTYAGALAGAGRCAEAERQLAEAQRLDPASTTYREAPACTPRG